LSNWVILDIQNKILGKKGEVISTMTTNTKMNYVSNFILSMSLPESIATGVLQTIEDCDYYYIEHHGKNRFPADDLLDFREYKIEKENISLNQFLDLCEQDGIANAFPRVFLQSFSLVDMAMVNDALNQGRTSLEELFADFKKNPNKNIMKNVL
jgi:hypothetical protein